jgi:flagellar protein FliO/FliZ
MLEALFGADMPLAVRFFLAFLIVLGLIGVTAWAVRRFGSGRLGSSSMRGRQPRLAVIDHANVDGRRRLILVRRDNVEHLLMVGGPSDIVVEPNIVRAAPAPRDVAPPRPAVADMLPRAIPLPDSSGNGSWPLQPEPANAPRAARNEPSPEEPAAWPLQPQAETPQRPQRDTLAALAEELSPKPPAPRSRPVTAPRPNPAPQRSEPRVAVAQQAAADPATAADQSLAEMAHRLEAALRKPTARTDGARADTGNRAPAPTPQPAPIAEPAAPAEAAESDAAPAALAPAAPTPLPRAARAPEATAPRGDAKQQPKPGKTLYDSLEQEMASLLGRPTGTGKT